LSGGLTRLIHPSVRTFGVSPEDSEGTRETIILPVFLSARYTADALRAPFSPMWKSLIFADLKNGLAESEATAENVTDEAW